MGRRGCGKRFFDVLQNKEHTCNSGTFKHLCPDCQKKYEKVRII